jgi:hypothetical protein
MWEEVKRILGQAGTQLGNYIADFLPGLVVALLLILVALVVAILARVLVVRALRGLDFDRRLEQWGLTGILGSAHGGASHTLAGLLYWTILVLGLLASLTALNATIPSQLALSVFEFLPHLVAALMILVVGAVAARFLARSVLIGAVNMQIKSARLLSLSVKWVVLVVSVAMALDHLGIGRHVLLLAFGIIFGGVVLAVALAVGLGARDAVSRAIERQIREPSQRGEDRVDHV